jgi:hypothetical protein
MPRRCHRSLLTATTALLAGVSIFVAHGAFGATARPHLSAAPHSSHPFSLVHSEPAHWVNPLAPHVAGTQEASHSTNWSGYVETGPTFTGASAQWIVPAVQPAQTALESGTWVGVDGANNSSLIQTGTAQETSGGSTDYYAWYEILPANAIEIGSVNPGDQITASVEQDAPGTWTISLTDLTSGLTATHVESYSGAGASAEWIEEAPTVNGQQSSLANFGQMQFCGVNQTNTNSVALSLIQVDMVDGSPQANVIAAPGSIGNNEFTDNDVSPGANAPTTTGTCTSASASPTETTSGHAVTYSASVTAPSGTPSGTITFTAGPTLLCTTSALVGGSGSCTATTAPVGTDTVTATYSGGSGFTPSHAVTGLTVGGSTTTTTTNTAPPPSTTTTTPPATANGYWLVGSDGGIFTYGSAQFHGSTGNLALQRPVVGITLSADRGGYWLVAADGGIFTFGDASFFGSIPGLGIAPAGSGGGGRTLNAPIVGMVPSANGGGYFMVAADGGVFAFGDAAFEGSCPGIGGCSGTAVTVMPDASGNGYWLVTATGHVYAFGDAHSFGEPGAQSAAVTSAVRTPDGQGYWILFANGAVRPFGDAATLAGPSVPASTSDPATAIFATADGHGYWVTTATGAISAFGDAPNQGGLSATHLNGSIIAGTGF